MRNAILAAMAAAITLMAPGAAQAATCVPTTSVCVPDVEETVEVVVETAEETEEEARDAVDEAGVSDALAAATKKTRAVANAVLTPVETADPVCVAVPDPDDPLCVDVGETVVAVEDEVCSQVPSPELERLVGWVTDRCFTGYP
jgi:hypothetical protein